MIPKDLRYTDQHEWVRVEGGVATVGITNHAQQALGDVTFVEPPNPGDEVKQGAEVCAIESCKAAASIYAPITGQVAEANPAVDDDPALVNSDPYGKGWIVKLQVADPSELDDLMDAEAYQAFLKDEEV